MKNTIRRGAALAMSLMMALASLSAAGAETNAETDVEALLSAMTPEEKICQMMVPGFRTWKYAPYDGNLTGTSSVNGSPAPDAEPIRSFNDDMRAMLEKYHFGGLTIFRENCPDPETAMRFISTAQTLNQQSGGLPLLIGTDQEGGTVARLVFGSMGTGNMALAATGDTENARLTGEIFAQEMKLLGMHADYAPVADVNNNPANPIIGTRSFSDDPGVVSDFSAAFARGLQENGIIAVVKHFPGHGNTGTDSHTGFPVIMSTLEELRNFELVPFRACIDAGAEMIMTAHIQYPNIEPETRISVTTGEEVHLPATMSPVLLQEVLRGEMGYDGLIISDALDMAAILDNFSMEDILTLTINAGVNILLMPVVYDSGDVQVICEMAETAFRLAREGKISMERVDDSVRRILELKAKHGLLSQKDFTLTEEEIGAAVTALSGTEHRDAIREIARKAVTLLRSEEGAFPLDPGDGKQTLVVFSTSGGSRSGNGEMAARLLKEAGKLQNGSEIVTMKSTPENGEECLRAAEEADHVILVYRVYSPGNLSPTGSDGESIPVFRQIIEKCHEQGKKVILISCQLPYDAVLFPEADAVLLTYNAAGSLSADTPLEGVGSGWIPNLTEALLTCFGEGTPEGKLPVNLYGVDEEGQFTEEIAWKNELGK